MKCKDCENVEKCLDHKELPELIGCTSGIPERRVPTNLDRVKAMGLDEMAQFLLDVNSAYACDCMTGAADCKYEHEDNGCLKCFKEWLSTEYKEENL